ncbi:type II toxin-antitoxin system RelE/ParE family toxin [Cellvibrio fontiphilus]|uniref:Type II toxin-antitoxin system RelE/ParE family toxin n=1 Tax=Cellvibrio fontiphilus TaxID=1815559 RepID=A0ABV7FEX5_9GAMM
MKVIWSARAVMDLEDIQAYIAKDNASYAPVFAARLLKATRHLPEFPLSGRIMPEAQQSDIRELLFQDYRIVYRVTTKQIEIVMVVHGSRNLENLIV